MLLVVALLAVACGGDDDSSSGGSSSTTSAAITPNADLKATEIGVSEDTIHIGVIADVNNAAVPGLFKGAVDAMEAWADHVNGQGGLAGRKVAVDFIDSKLSADAAQTALIQACENDFAIVGSAVLFLNNLAPMIGCKDKTGAATGLPDLPGLQTDFVHVCSPISFTFAGSIHCDTKDQHPQTYTENVGYPRYFKKTFGLKRAAWFEGNDIKGTLDRTRPIAAGEMTVLPGTEIPISGRAPQTQYTPIVQQLKRDGVDYVQQLAVAHNQALLLKEAQIQGFKPKVWSCTVTCYTKQYLDEAGSLAEGTYTWIPSIPLEEANVNKAVKTMVDAVGLDKLDSFGQLAWVEALMFRDAVNTIVKDKGENGLTRKNLLEALNNMHSFDADGMLGTVDVGAHGSSPCFMLLQVKGGKFTRAYPSKPNTLDCDESNLITVKYDNK